LTEDGTTVSRRYAVPGMASLALSINAIAPDVPLALDIQSDRPIVAERELDSGNGQATTVQSGAVSPETRWVFANGSTSAPAEQFLLVLNPGTAPVTLDMSYTLADGRVRHHSRTMPGASRLTIALANEIPQRAVASTTVIADRPIVVEQSTYIHAASGMGGETTLGSASP
jgi:hypothetical protein